MAQRRGGGRCRRGAACTDRAPGEGDGTLSHAFVETHPSRLPCRSLAQDHAKPALALGPADVQHRISGIVNAAGTPCPALPIAVCGIGDPERFRKDLADYGTAPSKLIATPDHCKNFEKHLLQAIREGHHAVITEKDSTRLRNEIRQNPAVFVARQQTSVSNAAFQAISALFSK